MLGKAAAETAGSEPALLLAQFREQKRHLTYSDQVAGRMAKVTTPEQAVALARDWLSSAVELTEDMLTKKVEELLSDSKVAPYVSAAREGKLDSKLCMFVPPLCRPYFTEKALCIPWTTPGFPNLVIYNLPVNGKSSKSSSSSSSSSTEDDDEHLPYSGKDSLHAAALELLKMLKASQTVVALGPSGCSKTRAVKEVLCCKWGHYLVATTPGNTGNTSTERMLYNVTTQMKESAWESNMETTKHLVFSLLLSHNAVLQALLSVKPNEMRPVDWLLFHSIRYFCRNSKEKEDLFLVLYEFVRKYNPKSVVDLLNKSTSSLTRACGKLVMVFDEAQNMLDGTFYLPQRGDKTPNVATTTEGGRPIISAVSRSVGELSVAASKNVRLLIAGTGIRLRLPDFVTTAIAKLELTSKVLYEFGFYSDAEELNEYLSIFLDLSSISIPQCLKDLMKRIVPGRYRFAASLIAALLTSNEPEDCVTEAFTKRLFNDEEEVGICHMLYNIWKNDPDHRPTFPTAPIHKAMELTRAFKVFGSHFVFSDEEEIALVEQGICMIQNDEDSLSGCMCEPLVADACNEFFKKWFNQDVFDLVKGLMGTF
eukprot:TRINITY_DN1159_c0_g1_i10.p1 TRINITY_DN1159_c0_g1~~TRINITY_DN1159_c0_g1_i10.p1  ORF type:complete len:677 (-),score=131.32 TRINITY_DN1159_c0_g1_i10:837-2618(-)